MEKHPPPPTCLLDLPDDVVERIMTSSMFSCKDAARFACVCVQAAARHAPSKRIEISDVAFEKHRLPQALRRGACETLVLATKHVRLALNDIFDVATMHPRMVQTITAVEIEDVNGFRNEVNINPTLRRVLSPGVLPALRTIRLPTMTYTYFNLIDNPQITFKNAVVNDFDLHRLGGAANLERLILTVVEGTDAVRMAADVGLRSRHVHLSVGLLDNATASVLAEHVARIAVSSLRIGEGNHTHDVTFARACMRRGTVSSMCLNYRDGVFAALRPTTPSSPLKRLRVTFGTLVIPDPEEVNALHALMQHLDELDLNFVNDVSFTVHAWKYWIGDAFVLAPPMSMGAVSLHGSLDGLHNIVSRITNPLRALDIHFTREGRDELDATSLAKLGADVARVVVPSVTVHNIESHAEARQFADAVLRGVMLSEGHPLQSIELGKYYCIFGDSSRVDVQAYRAAESPSLLYPTV